MGIQGFKEELLRLGLSPLDRGGGRIVIPYVPPLGRFAGQEIRLGFTVGEDWPLTPPGGLRVSPRLLPIYPGGDRPHPIGGVHEAADYEEGGATKEWQYWSRPFPSWQQTDRSIKAYLSHVHALFAAIV